MSDLRKAAQQALAYMDSVGQQDMYPEEWAIAETLRAALAQPEPEPWMGVSDNPYASDADCNDPNGRAMSWHNKLQAMQRKPLTNNSVREEAYRRCNAGWALMCKKMVAAEREAFVAIIEDNTDGDGICCADDLLAALDSRASIKKGGDV